MTNTITISQDSMFGQHKVFINEILYGAYDKFDTAAAVSEVLRKYYPEKPEDVKTEECINPLLSSSFNIREPYFACNRVEEFIHVAKVKLEKNTPSAMYQVVYYSLPNCDFLTWIQLTSCDFLTEDDLKSVNEPSFVTASQYTTDLNTYFTKVWVIAANKIIRDGGFTKVSYTPKIVDVIKNATT